MSGSKHEQQPAATKTPPKYLLIGTLDGENVNHFYDITESDMVLDTGQDTVRILKDGLSVVETLNQLVNVHGYQIVYYSNGTEETQIENLELLQETCKKNGLQFPKIAAMAVFDKLLPGVTSDNAMKHVHKKHGISIARWGADLQGGKTFVRQALEHTLGITQKDRKNHIVLDDNASSVYSSKAEGYQGFLISPQMSLDNVLKQVLSSPPKVEIVVPQTRSEKPAPKSAKKLTPAMKKAISDLEKHINKLGKYGFDLSEKAYDKNTKTYNMNSKEYIKGNQISLISETLANDLKCFKESMNKDSYNAFLEKSTKTLDIQRDMLQTHRDDWVPYVVIGGNILFALTGIGLLILAGNAFYVSCIAGKELTSHSAFFGMRTESEKIALEIESDLEEVGLRM